VICRFAIFKTNFFGLTTSANPQICTYFYRRDKIKKFAFLQLRNEPKNLQISDLQTNSLLVLVHLCLLVMLLVLLVYIPPISGAYIVVGLPSVVSTSILWLAYLLFSAFMRFQGTHRRRDALAKGRINPRKKTYWDDTYGHL
jgi:hypothetical protein